MMELAVDHGTSVDNNRKKTANRPRWTAAATVARVQVEDRSDSLSRKRWEDMRKIVEDCAVRSWMVVVVWCGDGELRENVGGKVDRQGRRPGYVHETTRAGSKSH